MFTFWSEQSDSAVFSNGKIDIFQHPKEFVKSISTFDCYSFNDLKKDTFVSFKDSKTFSIEYQDKKKQIIWQTFKKHF